MGLATRSLILVELLMRRKITLPYVHYADLNKMYGFGLCHATVWDALESALDAGYTDKVNDILF